MSYTVADLIVDTIAAAGVERIYGIPGDSLNGFTDSMRTSPSLHWTHVRHEEGAAFAASGEAAITGHLAVCAGSCGSAERLAAAVLPTCMLVASASCACFWLWLCHHQAAVAAPTTKSPAVAQKIPALRRGWGAVAR